MRQGSLKRRRQTCSYCGQTFSYSWYREHKTSCKIKKVETYNVQSTSPKPPENDENTHDIEDYQEDEYTECIHTDEVQEGLGAQLPASQLENLLKARQFEEEDKDFFDSTFEAPECCEPQLSNENHQPPATEEWDDQNDDKEAENDFREGNSEPCDIEDTPSPNNKVATLVLWIMLFLASWQSSYSITDTALTVLIKFLCRIFWLIGAFDHTVATLAKQFPNSHYKLKKALGLLDDDFCKYVVCPSCKSLYKFEDCIDTRSGRKVSAKCKFIAWPSHPHRARRGIV